MLVEEIKPGRKKKKKKKKKPLMRKQCLIKGVQKIVCGDEVIWWPGLDETTDGLVFEVLPRQSAFSRTRMDIRGRGKTEVLCSNLKQVVIIVAPRPRLRPVLVDRYLNAARQAGLKAVIVFNKMDLNPANLVAGAAEAMGDETSINADCTEVDASEEDVAVAEDDEQQLGHEISGAQDEGESDVDSEDSQQSLLNILHTVKAGQDFSDLELDDSELEDDEEDSFSQSFHITNQNWNKMEFFLNEYRRLQYTVIETSAKTGQGLDELRATLAAVDGPTLLLGQSGTGKSSLLNALIPDLQIVTKELMRGSAEGKHTTTTVTLFDLPDGGHVIDSPGFQNYGPAVMTPLQVSHGFVELDALRHSCKFSDCMHIKEPDCAVIEALKSEKITQHRYKSYLHQVELMKVLESTKYQKLESMEDKIREQKAARRLAQQHQREARRKVDEHANEEYSAFKQAGGGRP